MFCVRVDSMCYLCALTVVLHVRVRVFQLSMRINELENKRQFKCTWMNSGFREEVSQP